MIAAILVVLGILLFAINIAILSVVWDISTKVIDIHCSVDDLIDRFGVIGGYVDYLYKCVYECQCSPKNKKHKAKK